MFKLLTLLAAGMFLTLLIGGEDHGQMRQGLIAAEPANGPVLRTAESPANPDVTLATFSPATPVQVKPVSTPVVGGFVVMEAEKTAVVLPPPAVIEAEPELPIMYVSSRSVNVRGGPSTDYEVVGRLTRAEAVTVVSPEQDGWVQIRIEGDGIDGFIAARLLSETDPSN